MEETEEIIYDLEHAPTSSADDTQEASVDIEKAEDTEEASVDVENTGDNDSCDPQENEGTEEPTDPSRTQLDAILTGTTAEEILELIRKGRAYDTDVAKAEAKGVAEGRNTKIEHLLDSAAADRHPETNITSGHSVGRSIRSIFDLADLA